MELDYLWNQIERLKEFAGTMPDNVEIMRVVVNEREIEIHTDVTPTAPVEHTVIRFVPEMDMLE